MSQVGAVRVLPAWTSAYLVAAALPVFVWTVVTKIIRGCQEDPSASVWSVLDQVRSEIAWTFGLFLLTGTAVVGVRGLFVVVARRRRPRSGRTRLATALTWPVLVAGQLLLAATAVFDTLNNRFLAVTGSPLSLPRIQQYVHDFSDINAVISTQIEPDLPRRIAIAGSLLLLAAPAAALVVFRRGRPTPAGRWRPVRRRVLVPLSGAAAILLLVGAVVPASSVPAYLWRDGTANLVVGGVNAVRYDRETALDGPAAVAPTRTSLAPTASTRNRNVVMIFMESIRPSATTLYNPQLATTPFLDSLSHRAIVADNAYVVIPHTSKALTAAHCGIEPPMDIVNSESDPSGLPSRCLPSLLRDRGYSTVLFQSATEKFERRAELTRNLGFDQFIPEEQMSHAGFSTVNYFGYEDDVMLGPTADWLAAHRDHPFLASYMTVTSHHDYRPPDNYQLRHYVDDPQQNLFLNDVHYTDRFIKRLFEVYREAGVLDNTIFVISADHGEGFGEHGLRQHDNTIYDEGTHIPLMIIDPNRTVATHIQPPVQTISLLPTIVQLLGYTIEGGSYPAPSLLSPDLPGRVKISCFLQTDCLALVDGSHKFIYHFGERPAEYFDLRADPDERHNIIATLTPAQVDALRSELVRWHNDNAALYRQRVAPDSTGSRGRH